jgi:glycyl-tRNA synthetase beta chain
MNTQQSKPHTKDKNKTMPDLLLELGLEEVPARMIAAAQAELLKRTLALLSREQLIDPSTKATSYSTPRRLAVLIHDVRAHQADITEDTTGPAVKIAFKDGAPTPAAEAFARKNGIAVAELKTITTPKGEYLAATTVKRGRPAAEVLAAELPKEIAALYWAKSMYWRAGKPERFVRPVLWLACLLGDEIVPVSFAGKTAGRATYGHRVLSSGEPFEIVSPQSYLAQLEGEYVLADVEARRHKIRKALDKVTREVPGARWREDEALVDAVTHLTEWPDVLLGSFEPAYLELPEEVLVTVMRDHQKYFAVEDANDSGAPRLASETWETKNPLAPHFLTVTNMALDEENAAIIRQGNERVLRARFNDARFFWEFDQRVPLVERVKLLENVTFQKDLGSYAKKTERVRKIGDELGRIAAMHVVPFDLAAIDQAAFLAKTDLTTELVKEFTELQGIIGGLYAKSQGLSTTVADIIYDQYLPAGMDDSVPRSLEGAVFGIADRADTIAGMFRLGMEPTGSKDPFALRRAANSIVKILAETEVSLNIQNIITISAGKLEDNIAVLSTKTADKMHAFFNERIEFYLRDVKGFTYDVVAAVLAQPNHAYGFNNVRDAIARAEAITAVRGSEDFLAVCAAFKRMKNIVSQADESGITVIPVEIPNQVSMHPTQNALNNAVTQVSIRFDEFCNAHQYVEAVRLLATLRPEVDAFLDPKTGVKVMDDVPYIRETRINLLRQILINFSRIADFSEIVTAG